MEELKLEVAALRQEVAELRELVAMLSKPKATTPAPAPAAPAPAKAETIDETTMFLITAAIAAFLGKRATIKFVRPIHAQQVDGWRLQGRVAVQGSHRVR